MGTDLTRRDDFVECKLVALIKSDARDSLERALLGLCESHTTFMCRETCYKKETPETKQNFRLIDREAIQVWVREIRTKERDPTGDGRETFHDACYAREYLDTFTAESETFPASVVTYNEVPISLDALQVYRENGFVKSHSFQRTSTVFHSRFGHRDHVTVTISRFYKDEGEPDGLVKKEEKEGGAEPVRGKQRTLLLHGQFLVECSCPCLSSGNVQGAAATVAAFAKLLEPLGLKLQKTPGSLMSEQQYEDRVEQLFGELPIN
uniref:Mediator of RNA polymerase II transcription subunit 18 n=1 Tax=Chromera velia CCMP2878 TaxID=1169474 RepID=A0A0G4FSQ8_9ALVE|eukprot:Cvel_18497.t1-p1 / transcript=Cvel_18497.t1 / gene=Cvel_18497 / organism=Chromera_velia_CCMP2878 / gene_product=hypothetical protein / transcript_product=hypothetical protein / location=Cvel_scaffold1535:29379-31985(-) / protein_length=263 / sequence_SO=supercontig / SO=protein_coding / is_pseudo=false